jgi:type IV pilus assembly protein PilC
MLFSSRLSLSDLIELCRALRHNLSAGLSLQSVIEQQARKGPTAVRPIADQINQDLKRGEALEDALKKHKGAFPPLFLSLVSVGEQTGNLPEIFRELEKFFSLQLKLKRQFISQSTLPVLQLVAAIFVVAGLMLLLGLLAKPGDKPFDPLGMGVGPTAALRFLVVVFGILLALVLGYLFARRKLEHQEKVDKLLLRIPVVGPCMRAFALARFCLALRLIMETSLPIGKAMRLALEATGNAAYVVGQKKVKEALRGGKELTEALTDRLLFPEEFQNIVATGEEGGRLPEVVRHQSEHYEEEAGRRLTILTQMAGWGVWLFVAILIIICIFRIFMTYIAVINENMP